ncbi:hypothetical protein JXA12_05405, partial [Candidatus Woesearchaeota archaeon]|nr:hypothetical protein [Candidatus Woesearchaeota archaeon]
EAGESLDDDGVLRFLLQVYAHRAVTSSGTSKEGLFISVMPPTNRKIYKQVYENPSPYTYLEGWVCGRYASSTRKAASARPPQQ